MPSCFQRVCVFCGSSLGNHAEYREPAAMLGRELARAGVTLVYGGGRAGLMGSLADAALQAGGDLVGVMPRALVEKERAHTSLTELRVVHSMHERKALMADLADAFILLPGGCGSWEEFCEVITWAQLGIHQKPSGLLNTRDYYDALLAQAAYAVGEGFFDSLGKVRQNKIADSLDRRVCPLVSALQGGSCHFPSFRTSL